jgi:hypothetical protein
VTVKCFEDNALIKSTLADWPDAAGAVLVVERVVHYAQRWSVT